MSERCGVKVYNWECALPIGHSGDHDYHEPRRKGNSKLVVKNGKVVSTKEPTFTAAELELAKLEGALAEHWDICCCEHGDSSEDDWCPRIADLQRQIDAKRQAMRAIADGGKA